MHFRKPALLRKYTFAKALYCENTPLRKCTFAKIHFCESAFCENTRLRKFFRYTSVFAKNAFISAEIWYWKAQFQGVRAHLRLDRAAEIFSSALCIREKTVFFCWFLTLIIYRELRVYTVTVFDRSGNDARSNPFRRHAFHMFLQSEVMIALWHTRNSRFLARVLAKQGNLCIR